MAARAAKMRRFEHETRIYRGEAVTGGRLTAIITT
jgi:hypothetical protein